MKVKFRSPISPISPISSISSLSTLSTISTPSTLSSISTISSLSSFLLLLLLPSCKDSADPVGEPGNYTSGVFVVNEGPWGGTGSITWHNPQTGETVADVFGRENNGAALGEFVESIEIVGDKAYIVVNGDDKIVVVDAVTFRYIKTISGFVLPRFMYAVDNKIAYVTEWGVGGTEGTVARVDLESGAILKRANAGSGPEKMFRDGNTLIVANGGGYGIDSTLTYVFIPGGDAAGTVDLGYYNPCCIVLPDFDDFTPFVLAKGDWASPATRPGWVGSFTNGAPAGHILPQGADDLCASPDHKALYCGAGGSVWQIDSGGAKELFPQKTYGLNCDPVTGNLFCADPKDFNSNGEVTIRKPDGTVVSSFTCGIAPGEVVFIR